jgi:putative cell wall-binding protein
MCMSMRADIPRHRADVRAALAIAVFAIVVSVALLAPTAAAAIETTSLRGADRYETAVAVSKAAYPAGANAVIVVNGTAWADALGGSALAGEADGPILLSQRAKLPAPSAAELKRLAPSTVYLLGGTASLAPAIRARIAAIVPGAKIVRIGGPDRYAVARAVAGETARLAGGPVGTAFVTTGRVYTDALSCAPVAAAESWPIYLMEPTRDPAGTIAAMKAAGVTRVVIAGGPASVPWSTSGKLQQAFGAANVSRLAGADRYVVSVAVSDFAASQAGFTKTKPGFASGEAYADALSGAVYLGKQASPLLLLEPDRVPQVVSGRLWTLRNAMQRYTFLGGPVTIPWHVRLECQHALRAPAFSRGAAMSHVRAIAGFGPRGAGSSAERRAAEYVAARLQEYGYATTVQTFPIPGGKTSRNVVAEKVGATSDTIRGRCDRLPPTARVGAARFQRCARRVARSRRCARLPSTIASAADRRTRTGRRAGRSRCNRSPGVALRARAG